MSKTVKHFGRLAILAAFIVISALPSVCRADTIAFADDFNRPNGSVGNGWSPWGNPQSSIVGGQLQTFGSSGNAGGIYRTLSLNSPLSFSFDVRTESTKAPGAPYNDGGWYIAFDSVTPTYFGPGQLFLYQYAGSRTVNRVAGSTQDSSPPIQGAIPGWEDFDTSFSHVSGSVSADLSTNIVITYSDGVSVYASFAPAAGGPIGSYFLLGNSNASAGPDYFDNLVITETGGAVPEPRGLLLIATGTIAGLVFAKEWLIK